MNYKSLSLVLLCAAFPLTGHTQEACTFSEESADNCVRFVGCFNNGEASMAGTARGWEGGTLFSEDSDGRTCSGTWDWNRLLQKGRGTYTCDDGDSADIHFFARDEASPVTTGVSVSKKGKRLSMWSGPDLKGYFKQKFPEKTESGFPCGDNWIAFPETYPDKTQ